MLLDEASLANKSISITFIFCIKVVSGLISNFFKKEKIYNKKFNLFEDKKFLFCCWFIWPQENSMTSLCFGLCCNS